MHLDRRLSRKTIAELQSTSDTQRRGNVGFVLKLSDTGLRIKTCQWIEGIPTAADYRKHGTDKFKCGIPTQEDSSWCPDHHKRCFVKPPLTDKD